MFIENINFAPLLKAFKKFEVFRVNLNTEQERAGVIQAFEYCYELTWKMMQRLLKQRGIETGSPRDAFRMAAVNSLIDDPEVWFEFLKKRNLTVHTYDEQEAEAVLSICSLFSMEVRKFLKNVGIPDDLY